MPSPFPIEPFDITGHMDGFAVRYAGGVVDVFPTLTGAAEARSQAMAALMLLREALAKVSS